MFCIVQVILEHLPFVSEPIVVCIVWGGCHTGVGHTSGERSFMLTKIWNNAFIQAANAFMQAVNGKLS